MERAFAILLTETPDTDSIIAPTMGVPPREEGKWEGLPGILWPSISSSFFLLSVRIYPTKG